MSILLCGPKKPSFMLCVLTHINGGSGTSCFHGSGAFLKDGECTGYQSRPSLREAPSTFFFKLRTSTRVTSKTVLKLLDPSPPLYIIKAVSAKAINPENEPPPALSFLLTLHYCANDQNFFSIHKNGSGIFMHSGKSYRFTCHGTADG
jgi:hypothetical protein